MIGGRPSVSSCPMVIFYRSKKFSNSLCEVKSGGVAVRSPSPSWTKLINSGMSAIERQPNNKGDTRGGMIEKGSQVRK